MNGGDRGEVVPLQQPVKLAEAIGQHAHLEIINGAGHALDNIGELEGVINQLKCLQQHYNRI